MATPFRALAEPTRRQILDLLLDRPRSVGELVERLGLPQSGISKHLRVLREAGLVRVRRDAQRRWYELRHTPLQEIDSWLAPYRRLWTEHLDALERRLDGMPHSPESHVKDHAMNETLQTVDGRSVLRFERRLQHPLEKVWRAVTESKHLAAWFPARLDIDRFDVGGKIEFVFPHGEGPTLDGVITELDPPHVFAYTWADTTLRFELRSDGSDCVLVFTQTFDDRPAAASFAAGWHYCLDALDDSLAGRPVGGFDRHAELHEAYVDAFDLTEGEVRETDDGWLVRFERQFPVPVDKVWVGLVGPAEPAVGDTAPSQAAASSVPARSVVAVEAPNMLECDWLSPSGAAGRVRWELAPGPGGARVVLTQTLPEDLADSRARLLADWHRHVETLAERLSDQPRSRDGAWGDKLVTHYAEAVGQTAETASGTDR